MGQDSPVDRENLGLGDEADIFAMVDDWQIPGVALLKFVHDRLHALVRRYERGRDDHKLAHERGGVFVLIEHYGAYVVKDDDTDELIARIDDGEDVSCRLGYYLNQIAKSSLAADRGEVSLYDLVEVHEGEDSLVSLVRQELTLVGQGLGVDALRLEERHGDMGQSGGHHEWEEEGVAVGNLGYEEDGRHWRMHYASHDPSHADEREVGDRQRCTEDDVETLREKETSHAAHEK